MTSSERCGLIWPITCQQFSGFVNSVQDFSIIEYLILPGDDKCRGHLHVTCEVLKPCRGKVSLHLGAGRLDKRGMFATTKVRIYLVALEWRHNERDGVLNHRRLGCLFNCLFRRRSKKTSEHRVKGIHYWPVDSPHKGSVIREMFPFDDVIMASALRWGYIVLGQYCSFCYSSYYENIVYLLNITSIFDRCDLSNMNVIQGTYQIRFENFSNGEIGERKWSVPHPWVAAMRL